MRTRNGQKEKLHARIVMATKGESFQPTGIDFQVGEDTQIKHFGEMEERLKKMFPGVEFDFDFHWEKVDG